MKTIDHDQGLDRRAGRAAKDQRLAEAMAKVSVRFGKARQERLDELGDFAGLRERLNRIKEEVLSGHEALLDKLTREITARGGRVHRAADAAEAREIIGRIARAAGARTVVKSKSMTTEEVELNPHLEALGMEVFETDLGEYIIQLAGETPFHIVLPAIHKTAGQIAALFAEKLGMDYDPRPEALTAKARQILRQKFLAADIGVTGANALIAENGALALFENEGNIRMTMTLPRVHVALVGIEKLLPRFADLAVLAKLLPRSATGQKLSAYLSVLRPPTGAIEGEGPREFHLVLLDNGRRAMGRDPVLREALKCIRCGACINVCPVFQHVGGHAYGSVYPGPIGAMITESLTRSPESCKLPFLSTLCGACDEVCSAAIPIHEVLLELRRRASMGPGGEAPRAAWPERAAFRAWSELWSRPSLYRLTGVAAGLAGKVLGADGYLRRLPPPGSAWTRDRDFPAPARPAFHERWKAGVTAPAAPAPGPVSTMPADNETKSEQKKPAPEQPVLRLRQEIEALGGEVLPAKGKEEARARLREVLAEFAGSSISAWDHPDLEQLGLAELARELGTRIGNETSAVAGVTAVDYALAESGTLALITAPGRARSVSLVPPVHVAVVRTERIVEGIDELMDALAKEGPPEFSSLTLITGPSRTADIELIPVIGVHGPARLVVILWGP